MGRSCLARDLNPATGPNFVWVYDGMCRFFVPGFEAGWAA